MRKLFQLLSSKIALFIFFVLSFAAATILAASLQHAKKTAKPIIVDREILNRKISLAPPEWMLERIKTDLSRFSEQGISHQMIDKLFQGERIGKYSLIRFTIKNSRLSFSLEEKQLDSRHFRHLLAAIKKLNELVKLPDVDFVVSLEDGFDSNPEGFPISPCFVFAKSERSGNFVLMPDFKALGGYGKLRQQILDANPKFPWERKTAQAFWRGSTTSGFFDKDNWDRFCRGKLVLSSLASPKEIDARFTSVVQCTPDVPSLMKAKGMVSKCVEKADHLKYKYLVDVDGNSCTYERCFWLLLSNSLLLKQITPNIQWYYGGLKPYVHFLPLREDLSDLLEKIEWAKAHDAEAMAMAKSSTEFVQENLSAESIFQYMALLLTEYAKLQR
jgi:hypothetical protein